MEPEDQQESRRKFLDLNLSFQFQLELQFHFSLRNFWPEIENFKKWIKTAVTLRSKTITIFYYLHIIKFFGFFSGIGLLWPSCTSVIFLNFKIAQTKKFSQEWTFFALHGRSIFSLFKIFSALLGLFLKFQNFVPRKRVLEGSSV